MSMSSFLSEWMSTLNIINHHFARPLCSSYGLFTLSETENDFCSETDEMAKNNQSDWLLLAMK